MVATLVAQKKCERAGGPDLAVAFGPGEEAFTSPKLHLPEPPSYASVTDEYCEPGEFWSEKWLRRQKNRARLSFSDIHRRNKRVHLFRPGASVNSVCRGNRRRGSHDYINVLIC
jgi:hypothetical protein